MYELPDPLGSPEVLEAMRAQITQLGTVRQSIDDEIACRGGNQGLAAVTDRTHAGAADDRGTDVVSGVPEADLPRVQRHPHANFAAIGPGLLRKRALHVEGRRDRVGRASEGPHHAVALALFHGAG